MDNTKLTSVKILKSLYDSFKVATVNTKMTLQKITNRSVYLYMNDEKYRDKRYITINITEDNWKAIKERFGFAPTCSCQKRKEWLNNVSEVFLGK